MTTLPFDAHLPLGIFLECEVTGSVTTDAGASDPYFKVYAIRIDGQAYQVGGLYPGWVKSTLDLIADKAATDTDTLADAMRIEGWSWSGLGANDPDSRWIRPVDPDVMMAAE